MSVDIDEIEVAQGTMTLNFTDRDVSAPGGDTIDIGDITIGKIDPTTGLPVKSILTITGAQNTTFKWNGQLNVVGAAGGATAANSGSNIPFPVKPSSPPRPADPLSSEYMRAKVENSESPLFTLSVKSLSLPFTISVS